MAIHGHEQTIWSGPGAAATPHPAPRPRTEEEALLNGLALPGAAVVSQDAVDALFG